MGRGAEGFLSRKKEKMNIQREESFPMPEKTQARPLYAVG
jgi:hypothetical protein